LTIKKIERIAGTVLAINPEVYAQKKTDSSFGTIGFINVEIF